MVFPFFLHSTVEQDREDRDHHSCGRRAEKAGGCRCEDGRPEKGCCEHGGKQSSQRAEQIVFVSNSHRAEEQAHNIPGQQVDHPEDVADKPLVFQIEPLDLLRFFVFFKQLFGESPPGEPAPLGTMPWLRISFPFSSRNVLTATSFPLFLRLVLSSTISFGFTTTSAFNSKQS